MRGSRIEKFLEHIRKTSKVKFGMNELREIDYGLTRVTFLIESGPHQGQIIKFARRGRNKNQNRREIETWRSAKGTEYEKYFCPIFTDFSDLNNYEYLVMEKADTDVSLSQSKDLHSTLKQEFGEDAYDTAIMNMGIHSGKIKMIDYPWGKI